MANGTSNYNLNLPPRPVCNLTYQAPLIAGVSDSVLATFLPSAVYAISSLFYYWLGELDLFSDYRIHPSEEELKRNHVSRLGCLRGVVRYHAMAIATGLLMSYGEAPPLTGNHDCDVYDWAVRVRHARKAVPWALALMGVDAKGVASAYFGRSAALTSLLAGSPVPVTKEFTTSEMYLASLMVDYGLSAVQYLVALIVVDTWIYFTHRLCHMNKTIYRIVHAQHHRLYVSYAFGAVYAHWLESVFVDILSFILAGHIAQLSARQSMIFGSWATFKTISDHCGYVFPWDPLSYLNKNDSRFHDLHHQSWGLKHNFSTYTVFWDNLLGTSWTDEAAATTRYRRVQELTKQRSAKGSSQQTGPVIERASEVIAAEGSRI